MHQVESEQAVCNLEFVKTESVVVIGLYMIRVRNWKINSKIPIAFLMFGQGTRANKLFHFKSQKDRDFKETFIIHSLLYHF